jgi:glycerophosphoryl diester phosphodiesterase
MSTLRRVGHKGADLIAPGNTRASFDAALAAGVDMIEFDVLISRDGDELLLAHDYKDVKSRAADTLEEGLAHLAAEAFSGVEIDVDLKLPGYELRVLRALEEFGLVERAVISSQYLSSLQVLRETAGSRIRLGGRCQSSSVIRSGGARCCCRH